jgi:hypothetical protein
MNLASGRRSRRVRSGRLSERLGTLNDMDLEAMLRDAALMGLAAGVIVMAAALLWGMGVYLLKPTAAVAAAITKPPFGFCVP